MYTLISMKSNQYIVDYVASHLLSISTRKKNKNTQYQIIENEF